VNAECKGLLRGKLDCIVLLQMRSIVLHFSSEAVSGMASVVFVDLSFFDLMEEIFVCLKSLVEFPLHCRL
jgi:hypothetical protein